MSSSVDDKVVKMTFDNAAFESKMAQTLGSLDKLKQNLNFEGGKQALGDLSSAAKNFTMEGMSSSVEKASAGFVAMSAIAITALAGIAAKAVTAGADIVKSLTLSPVMDGFKEYETNMGSIQTILANTKSKGSTLDDVNAALDNLNNYSDKTIYNFAEMARNIGTFTAAGVALEPATQSIKGIANLAAMSGSTAEQGASAMYQLSQAMSSGTLKAQDWISVNNAGIGGEAFQSSLFETAKAMGTITDVPIEQTFTQWKDAGGNFKEAMADGVFTSDVLGQTLQNFTGEVSDAELLAKGFSEAQIAVIKDNAATATAAATEVKTFTQLMGTVKESVGTGFADSFKILIGNFDEAKGLFTAINNAISGFVTKVSTARNDMLTGWKAMGGRNDLIEGIVNAFKALNAIMKPIKEAFREIFPKKTTEDLINMTHSFKLFTERLIIGGGTAEKIKSIFTGVFSVFSIGIEIVKGIVGVIGALVSAFFDLGGGGGILDSAAGIGDFVANLREMLVEGHGIDRFFDVITDKIRSFAGFISDAKEKIAGLFGGGIPGGEKAEGIIDKFKSVLDGLTGAGDKAGDAVGKVGGVFEGLLGKIKNALGPVGDLIKDFFGGLGDLIASVFTGDAFAPVLATVGTGLFGGFVLLFKKFVNDGLKLDFGQVGLFDSITGTFDQLTNNLKTMQQSVKADILLKIAAAVGILAASIFVMSGLDPAQIGAAMAALAGGMGALVGSLALLSKIESNPAKLAGLALSMILIAGAAFILSFAIKRLGALSWDELAKGLTGVVGVMVAMAGATRLMDGSSFIRGAVSIGILSIALWAFSKVLKIYADMPFGEMVQGLVSVGAALGIFVLAANLSSEGDMLKLGLAFTIFAFGLKGMQKAIQSFADMSWNDMIKGFIGLAVALGLIVVAFALLPNNMMDNALSLIAVSAALYIMSKAVASMGELSITELLKGLVGIAVVLGVLVLAANAMSGAAGGALAIVIMAGALFVLGKVLKSIGQLSWGELLKGLIGIAGVLILLGAGAALLTPLLPAMLALGIALSVIGIGFALFGIGAEKTANALLQLSKVGKKAIDTFIEVINALVAAIPGFAQKFAEGVLSFVDVLLDAAPRIIDSFGDIMIKILDKIIEIMPKIGEAFAAIVQTAAQAITDQSEAIVTAGWALLMAFLSGIRDNIGEMTTTVSEIMVNFMDALTAKLPEIASSAAALIVAFLTELGNHVNEIIVAATTLITQFLFGITIMLPFIITAATTMITTLITQLGEMAEDIVEAGTAALVSFFGGVTTFGSTIVDAAVDVITEFINKLGDGALRLVGAGLDATIAFLKGVATETVEFTRSAAKVLIMFLNSLASAIEDNSEPLRAAGRRLAFAIADGMSGGLASKVKEIARDAADMAGAAIDAAKGMFGINSPSKVFHEIGQNVAAGLSNALREDSTVAYSAAALATSTVDSFGTIVSKMANTLSSIDEFNPTITPVLDLTNVTKDAKGLSNLFGDNPVAASLSYGSAKAISSATRQTAAASTEVTTPTTSGNVEFNQTINSPVALSAGEIYRNTRSQISLAKGELSIP